MSLAVKVVVVVAVIVCQLGQGKKVIGEKGMCCFILGASVFHLWAYLPFDTERLSSFSVQFQMDLIWSNMNNTEFSPSSFGDDRSDTVLLHCTSIYAYFSGSSSHSLWPSSFHYHYHHHYSLNSNDGGFSLIFLSSAVFTLVATFSFPSVSVSICSGLHLTLLLLTTATLASLSR